jgi:hypothetical protein
MLNGVNLTKVCLRLFCLPAAVIYSWQVKYRSKEHGFEADKEILEFTFWSHGMSIELINENLQSGPYRQTRLLLLFGFSLMLLLLIFDGSSISTN